MAQPSPLDLIREATAAARANDKPRVRELLVQATTLDPKNETAWQWLADVAETPLEASGALERVLALNPDNQKAKAALRPIRLKAGIEAAKAKNVPVALRLLQAAVAEDPANEFGWLWLASVCDSPSEALAHLRRVLAINPTNAAARKGVAYFENKLRDAGTVAPPLSPSPAAVRKSGIHRAPPRDPIATSGRTVLVIDSSRTIRKLVGLTLGMDGFKLVEAADLSEAADRLRTDGIPDLLVVDVNTRGADVYEFCELFRQNPDAKHVPVFLLTGKDGVFDKFKARSAGIDAFLPKPLHPELILHTARAHRTAAQAVAV